MCETKTGFKLVTSMRSALRTMRCTGILFAVKITRSPSGVKKVNKKKALRCLRRCQR